jgi:sortase B
MRKIITSCIAIIFIFSIIEIIVWLNDSNETKELITEINNKEYPNKNIVIDLSYYYDINNDTVGYIDVKNTNISYPIVKSKDNKYYLNHSFNKSKNNAGWVFMDYRNNNFKDQNTILYAHDRKDNTMFGTLKNTLKKEWYNNKNNHLIKLIYNNELHYYQVFSTYIIKTESYYLQINFNDKNNYSNFIKKIIKRSNHNYKLNVTTNDKILTLSTCYTDTKKLVLHAKRLD